MKHVLLILLMPIAAALNSCSDSAASPSPETETEAAPENGAQYKEGKGVTLTPLMAQSIQLKTAEVQEEVIAHSYSATLQATQIGNEASGWLTEEQASGVVFPGVTPPFTESIVIFSSVFGEVKASTGAAANASQ